MENIIVVALKALIVHRGKVLLVQRSATDEVGASTWEFAGGKLDFGETPEAALSREVHEETGLHIQVGRPLYAATFMSHPWRQMVILCYHGTSDTDVVTLSHEHQAHVWATPAQMRQLLPDLILHDLERHGIWATLGLK